MELAFTKLFNKIVTSSVWSEDDKTRIMWITMLALSDRNGYVAAALPGLADVSRMSLTDAKNAIKKLESPDEYSRSKIHDGKRIIPVNGGWEIVTYDIHRKLLSAEERKEYKAAWIKKRRQESRQMSTDVEKVSTFPSASASSSLSVRNRKPSTQDELLRYAKEQGVSESDARGFFDSQEAGGWTRAGKPLHDWKASLRSWKANGFLASQKKPRGIGSGIMTKFGLPLPKGCSIRGYDNAVLDSSGRVMDINQVRRSQ